MTRKELSQLYWLNREIERDRERLEELRTLAAGLNVQAGGGSRGSGGVSSVEKYVAEIVDLEAIIAAKRLQCLHERNRLERWIRDIPDSFLRQIFTLRFVNGFSWRKVALNLGGGNTEDGVRKQVMRYLSSGK